MIKEGIKKLINSENLSTQEIEAVFTEIMQGEATAAQIGSFITALRIKGETIDEITGAAIIMRKFATPVSVKSKIILDTCGTGGSGKHLFNVSTLTALIASAAGVTVAKHGNRSVSSKSGSADLLEKLGVNINAEPVVVEKCINEIGIGFLFAPTFHKAMKFAIGPRKEIGIRTVFNVLGPLTNPASATHQLLGVFDKSLIEPLAKVLGNLGIKHALVVHGADGIDEISISTQTYISEINNGTIKNYTVTPEEFGIERASFEKDTQILDPDQSVKIAKDILSGRKSKMRDTVVLNAAFALYAADFIAAIDEGLTLAKKILDEGKAQGKLNLLIKYSNGIYS